ncbi:chain i, clathrin d6 coat with auxilin j-domain [Toxoplasma gondii TgCatPRC2]|uniref:Clathrin heavy chain n=16 Tax=Toxoplasma gondii TaxID=5811 RepID=B9PTE8_TOXGV|nr:putative clathrin heavy chain [Toxoplasma gondii GT1]ESS33913.1 putative clathrin heavy chain [Toxoplasma gondii VEG]KAF4644536.1 putative clathrin heavy chain [Toxoplasma gondii]KFG99969.1 chain i, clathrin d6 coat with auxilin j-domain [Toxoplasma gondii VAND]KYK69690.1 chain i, clathrin d6 coat with auxilin j-domain [Toxoplasma gondii TgCatPRC2]
MAQQFPIQLHSVVNLADQGVSASSFRFGNVAMHGDKNLVVKDTETNELFIFSLSVREVHEGRVSPSSPGFSFTKKPTQAEAALMHPSEKVVALRAKTEGSAGHMIQVLNLETKVRLGTAQMNEPVVYWRWVAPTLLALVTDRAVYHWTVGENGETTAEPEKVCSREGRLADAVQIISYAVDKDLKWCILTGISTQDGGKTIDGSMQLYSMELKKQQQLEGHAACFNNIVIDEAVGPQPVICFTEKKRGSPDFKLHIRDIYSSRDGGQTPLRLAVDLRMPEDAPTDFPLSIHISQKFGVVYIVTKGGYLILLDALTGTELFRHRILQDAVFLATDSPQTGGILTVNKRGLVCLCNINLQALIPYINQALVYVPNRQQIATSLAKRYGLPGAEETLMQEFNQHFASGNFKTAARIAATLKSGVLRTAQVIQQFKSVPTQPGQTSAILVYFSTLLEYDSLNAVESLELVRPVAVQGRKDFVEKWLREGKLECTEELGDVVRTLDAQLAVRVYREAKAGAKVLQTLTELGNFDEIIAFAKETKLEADYAGLLRNLVNVHPENAVKFAQQLLSSEPPLADVTQVSEVLLQQHKYQEFTSLMLDFLKGNKPEQGPLQTRLLEVNLLHSPQVAETIFQMEMLTHFDRAKIAALCEKVGLSQRALELYTDIADIKRVMLQSGGKISQEFTQQFFGNLPPDASLEILTDMLRSSSQNLQAVVAVAIKFHGQIGTTKLVEMFEKFSSYEGVFYFLGSILAFSSDPEVHFKYIEAAAKLNHTQEVERVCRESKCYEPQRVKEFLKQVKLPDPRPLIYVCDLHGYVTELAEYLFKNSLLKYIEVYVSRVNSANAPLVIGTLIDQDAAEDFIRNLLQSVRGGCSAQQLVEEFEKRNRLRLLLQWLEARVAEGNQEPAVHNALAKIYIDTNRDAESFLKTNAYYDSLVVGKYCEERDPHLAFTAYKRAWGACDEQLVELTNKNGLFRLQARYLVERQAPELWAYVLREENPHRRQAIDQVVSSALPESSSADEVSAAVNAFINAQLPHELIELLEKIVLHNSDFSNNKNLQNLLILTAMKADSSRIIDYVNRLHNYDGAAIAQVAMEYGLREEAFTIYKRFGLFGEAADTLLKSAEEGSEADLERAVEFAQRCNEADVWRKLGRAQLRQKRVRDAIESFLKAGDGDVYKEVVEAAAAEDAYDALVDFLLMARKKITVKDQVIDSELVYAYAKTDRLEEMDAFLSGTNTANVQAVGDRLFAEQRYKAAKLLYASLPNYAKLASCFVRLEDFAASVDAARKAKNPKTWKEVAFAALSKGELKCAHAAALSLIVHPDHLDSLIERYEQLCLFKELIELLEQGLQGERTHVGLYTELGVLYATYESSKLMDYIRQHSGKVNIPRLIRACERQSLWKEAVYLHMNYDEYEQAANCLIMHPAAWSHELFVQILQKVSNSDVFYRAISFYLEYHPLQLCLLLKSLDKKLDHSRVVQHVRKAGHLAVVEKYLRETQHLNITAVNEAVNELLVEGEDVDGLRESILEYDNFDQLALAQTLENHPRVEMRRLAALLFKKNRKFKQAIELSKRDRQYQDAIDAARDSGNTQLVGDLLRFFLADLEDPAGFAACLYTCYPLVKPDVALELAWRHKCMDYCMPFLIQVVREVTTRVDALDKKEETREKEEEKQKSAPNDYVPDYTMPPTGSPLLPGMGGLALMPPSYTPQSNAFPPTLGASGMMGSAPANLGQSFAPF